MVVVQVTNQIAIRIVKFSEGSAWTNLEPCQTFKMDHFAEIVCELFSQNAPS